MLNLNGSYPSTLDPKGRVKLPSSLLKQFGEGAAEFMLVQGMDTCVRLFTLEAWDKYTEPIRNLSDFNPEARVLKQLMLNGNNKVELDGADRILIPKMLVDKGKLDKELKIVCLFDKVEIWDAQLHDQKFGNYSSEDLSALAAKLLGNT
ncbi:MAG: division/cell wall cluster transcriptional repressor MraZ [Saprospiraceae bacterium]